MGLGFSVQGSWLSDSRYLEIQVPNIVTRAPSGYVYVYMYISMCIYIYTHILFYVSICISGCPSDIRRQEPEPKALKP